MGEQTKIAWCDHTFSPWKEVGDERIITGDAYWRMPLRWDRLAEEAGVRRRVFCASLADVFEDRSELEEPRLRLFRLIVETPNLDWLLLTKRPEFARDLIGERGSGDEGDDSFAALVQSEYGQAITWPPPNMWLGVTAEDQECADERIPILLDIPAAVRFVSYEPGLGPIALAKWLPCALCRGEGIVRNRDSASGYSPCRCSWQAGRRGGGLDWVIVGGESGPHARPFDIQWARDTISQCRAAGVPVFVKQLGAKPVTEGRELELIHHRSGADPSEGPEDLLVQEWPR
jgi:protein gp37